MRLVPYGATADPSETDKAYHSRPGLVRLDGPAVGDGLVEVFPSSTSYYHHKPLPLVVAEPEAAAEPPKRLRDAKGRLLPKE